MPSITKPTSRFPMLTDAEMVRIAPLRDGRPDLYNHMPSRRIPLQEAQERDWVWFFDGKVCTKSHRAPRYVSNPDLCVDCHRIKKGKLPIGDDGARPYALVSPPVAGTNKAPVAATRTKQPLEPDPREKRFLIEYARVKNFDKAAGVLGVDPAIFRAALSYSKVFRDAVEKLEDENQLSRTLTQPDDFEWDDDKRRRLVEMYINTGNLMVARDAIQVTNARYLRELRDNPAFARMIEEAYPYAVGVLREHAIDRSIKGDSKLLTLTLQAEDPKYGQKLKVDMTVAEKLSDEQLDARWALVLQRLGPRAIEAPAIEGTFQDITPVGETGGAGDSGSEVAASGTESNLDLL
jgi:hypothetical protein